MIQFFFPDDKMYCVFTEKNLNFFRTVPLEPFVHQVGGHFPMACLASDIVCKPLNEREHKFYKSMSRSLVPFVPRYEGTMKVEIHEDDHGYIKFNSHPPRKFSSKRNLNHHQLLQLHLQGNIEVSSIKRIIFYVQDLNDAFLQLRANTKVFL